MLGDERRACAVRVDCAAFVDHGCAITITPFDLQHLARDEIVLVPREVQTALQAAPGVELPVDTADRAARVDYEGRPDIAHPAVVVRHLDDADMLRKQRPRVLEVLARDTDGDGLELRDRRGDTHERLLRRPCNLAPIVGALRPEHPAPRMRLELAGHPEAIRGGCSGERSSHRRRRLWR